MKLEIVQGALQIIPESDQDIYFLEDLFVTSNYYLEAKFNINPLVGYNTQVLSMVEFNKGDRS